MAMVRHARGIGRPELVHLVVSVRSPSMLYYRDEMTGPGVSVVFTREPPPEDTRGPGRLRVDDLAPHLRTGAAVFVCGSPAFCDSVSDLLLDAGVAAERIRVERFGASG
jgi:ferredoxin-NADP reductase